MLVLKVIIITIIIACLEYETNPIENNYHLVKKDAYFVITKIMYYVENKKPHNNNYTK